jgi:hypothetical protein
MIEKPVAWANLMPEIKDDNGRFLTMNKDVATHYNQHYYTLTPLFTESQLKAERERAIRECIESIEEIMLDNQIEDAIKHELLKLLDN